MGGSPIPQKAEKVNQVLKKYEIRRYKKFFFKKLNQAQKKAKESQSKEIQDKAEIIESAIVDLILRVLRREFSSEYNVKKIFLPVLLACIRKRSITHIIQYLNKKGMQVYSVNTQFAKLNEFDEETLKPCIDACRSILIEIGKSFGLTLRNLIAAIDINAIPYYGDHSPAEVMGNERKAGTNWTFKYLTCSIVIEGIRFVIESTPLTQLSLVPKEVDKLIRSAKKFGNLQLVLLDRGFNAVAYQDVINNLETRFLMPMVHNKKIDGCVADEKAEFKQIDHIYYEQRAIEYQRHVKVIITDKETEGKKHIFITNILCKDKNQIRLLVEAYRKRWGIETLFREKNKFSAFTCTTSYMVRNMIQQFAYILQDALVLINFILLNEKRRLERWEEMTNTDDFYQILYAFTMKLKTKFKLLVRSNCFIDSLVYIFQERIGLLIQT